MVRAIRNSPRQLREQLCPHRDLPTEGRNRPILQKGFMLKNQFLDLTQRLRPYSLIAGKDDRRQPKFALTVSRRHVYMGWSTSLIRIEMDSIRSDSQHCWYCDSFPPCLTIEYAKIRSSLLPARRSVRTWAKLGNDSRGPVCSQPQSLIFRS